LDATVTPQPIAATEPNEPIAELLFDAADGTPISTDESTIKSWTDAREQLALAPKVWLATQRPGGPPHVAPVLAAWLDTSIHVATRPTSRKGRNLAVNVDCVISVSTDAVDLVVECTAGKVCGAADLQRVTDTFLTKYGWRFTVRDGRVYEEGNPSHPEYELYALTPTKAFGYGTDGMTATRWRF
jgi:hypothetical protein